MSITKTTHYELNKPDAGDLGVATELNANLDIIDGQMKVNADAIASNASALSSHTHDYADSDHTHNSDDISISPAVGGKSDLRDILVDLYISRAANMIQTGIHRTITESTETITITAANILSEIGVVNDPAWAYMIGINYHLTIDIYNVNAATGTCVKSLDDDPFIYYTETSSIRHLDKIVIPDMKLGSWMFVINFRLIRIDYTSIFDNENFT